MAAEHRPGRAEVAAGRDQLGGAVAEGLLELGLRGLELEVRLLELRGPTLVLADEAGGVDGEEWHAAPITTSTKMPRVTRLMRGSCSTTHAGRRARMAMPIDTGMTVIANTRATTPSMLTSEPTSASKWRSS